MSTKQNPASTHIDSAKYVDPNQGKSLTAKDLRQRFPRLKFLGEVQQTGLIGVNQAGDFEVFVRHPWWVPVKKADNAISYGAGGKQTDEHITHLLGRYYGQAGAQAVARDICAALKLGNEPPYNALSIGKEQEAIAHDANTGEIVQLGSEEQFEFQAGVHEDALPPFKSLHEAVFARIKQLEYREQTHPGLLIMDTSSPLIGSPNDPGMQLNNGDGGNYIRPWSEHLKQHLVFSDRGVVRILNGIARGHGYKNYHQLMDQKGFQVLWPSIACQTNIGMPHQANESGSQTIPLELAIATADLFNSHLGAVADMLMASSPFVFGVAPVAIRDYRMALRNIFAGAQPGPFVNSRAMLQKRWQSAGLNGMLYTLDRLAFQTKRPGHLPHAMIYGTARIRVETKDPHMTLGRVENTIAGASPSLLDEIAHDTYIYLLTVAAFDAAAHGKNPADFFGDRFTHVKQWRGRKRITDNFNKHGAKNAQVADLMNDAIGLLEYLKQEYAPLSSMIDFVIARVKNMQVAPAADFIEYRKNAAGPISEVMMRMRENGHAPLEIMKQAYKYQHDVAREILPMAGSDLLFEKLNKL